MKAANFDRDEYLKHFDIRISKDMTKLDGRVLDPPTLCYKGGASVHPYRGAWDMKGQYFHNGVTVKKWGIVVFSSVRYFDEESLRYIYMYFS